MKKIIDGKVYDTDKAVLLGEYSAPFHCNDLYYFAESLYRSNKGNYFLHGRGHGLSKYGTIGRGGAGWGESIRPLSSVAARRWCEKNLSADETETIFGSYEEA